MKKLIYTAMIYSIAAIAAGVFYREFTKFNGYTGETVLRYIHVHLFALGMFLFLILALFCRQEHGLTETKIFKRFYVLYNISLPLMVCTMLTRGILQVQNADLTRAVDASVSGIAGISHILFTVSFFMLFKALMKDTPESSVRR